MPLLNDQRGDAVGLVHRCRSFDDLFVGKMLRPMGCSLVSIYNLAVVANGWKTGVEECDRWLRFVKASSVIPFSISSRTQIYTSWSTNISLRTPQFYLLCFHFTEWSTWEMLINYCHGKANVRPKEIFSGWKSIQYIHVWYFVVLVIMTSALDELLFYTWRCVYS